MAEQSSLSQQALKHLLLAAQQDEAEPVDAPDEEAKESSIGFLPYAALFGGQAADIGSTLHALRNGAVEANPLLGSNPSAARLIGTKLPVSLLMAYMMHKLSQGGHSTAAKWLGYGTGAALGGVAAHNMRQGK